MGPRAPTGPPRKGLARFLRWLVRLRGSPEAIAGGMAIGTLVAFTPTLGVQMPLALLLTTLLNANRPVCIVPVWMTNPATAVPIYAFTYWVGSAFWTGPPVSQVRALLRSGEPVAALAAIGRDVLVPLWIGGLLVGALAALVAYPLTLAFVRRARGRLEQRRRRRESRWEEGGREAVARARSGRLGSLVGGAVAEDSRDGAARIALRFLEGHPEEAVRLLEGFEPRDAAPLLERCAPRSTARLLRCAVPGFAAGCLSALAPERAGEVLEALPLGQAASTLRRLDEASRARLLEATPERCAEALGRVLGHAEGTAGSLMNPRVLSLPADLSVAESVERLRRSSPDDLYYLYVVDRQQKLVGVVTYRQLLVADAERSLAEVMHQPVSHIAASARGETLRGHPAWKLYLALPVVDETGLLLGAVHRDAVLELERAAAARAPGGPAALGVAEMVWLGLSQTLGELLGPREGSGAPREEGRDRDER